MSIHQGGKLKHIVDNQSKSNAEIARLSGISQATLYNYFLMDEIPSKKLKIICEILQIDYVSVFVTGQNTGMNASDSSKMEALERENILLREQVEQLKEMVDLLKKKK